MKKAPPLFRTPPPSSSSPFFRIGPDTPQDILVKETKKRKTWNAAIFAACLIAVGASIVAIVLSGLNYAEMNRQISPSILFVSGVLNYSPYTVYLSGTGAPQTMTLPNDLTPYIGKIYRVWSLSNQAHKVQISGSGSTFTGGGVTATFLGGVGDGFVFEVISKNFISIISSTNVNFA